MVCITEKYPPLELNEIVNIANGFKQLSLKEKLSTVARVIARHPMLNFPTQNDTREFYRVRVSKDRSFPFNYTGVLWNHSAPAQQARLNAPGDAVLYVANQANAAFAETGVSDDFVIMSVLKIQDGKNVTFLPLGTFANIMRSNAAHLDVTEQIVKDVRRKILACPIHEMQALLISDEFLYNCIMEEDEGYAVSSYTANLIFKKYPSVDVITYPSKKLRSASNYAIKVSSFWDKWAIGSVCTLEAKHLALGHFLHSNVRCVDKIDNTGFMSWERSYPVHQNSLVVLNWVKPQIDG
ncbi:MULTISPECIES: RES family NAD+ phosphorylase [unclassified Pseudomonas]|uniref:RES family NAD+ phosphorylase n=1 Tax=unclassified Pseudomonas TaxID=196821 RepID=UPI000876AF1A|nr:MULTISPECIES: RES family NAD+ phosphorylase [unclassified Pseudomonas]SCZ39034.1 RES domain-containing protein [Pseudomonas sp. NFACC44-2]SDA77369.1 RES domain-containing protein [Pseudomonas sp. NFACC51]SFI09209.1 RES domain-containing protein [Pseudomonas sp. NFACC54]SFT10350.1 RES domain-containing protein [Pseudomonas sp. NFACC48-1]